jgi:hypothetical protein
MSARCPLCRVEIRNNLGRNLYKEAELAVWLYLCLLEYGAAGRTVISAKYRGQERLMRRAINELRCIKGGPSGWDVVYTVNKFQGRKSM